MKSALILYPHQLFSVEKLPEVERVVLVEEPLFFGMDQEIPVKLHKQKLILHRSSMQRYVEEVLWPANYQVDYIELDVFMSASDLLGRVKGFDHVYIFDPVDETLTQRLLEARRARGNGEADIEFLPAPNFYLKEQEIRDYFGSQHKTFPEFYQWQRERFNILIDENYKPAGGKWIFDNKKQENINNQGVLPSFGVFGDNKHVTKAIEWVNEHFPDNPGSTDFIWPTNHSEALKWLEDFIENRLGGYATHLDAINSEAPWLFHSVLSSSLNTGLLSPQQVVETALKHHDKQPIDIASLENFIRQVLGWREYTRGLYITRGTAMRNYDGFKALRRMSPAWYEGNLGLPPFDNLAKKLNARAYAHQSERLFIAANLMLLCEIHPEDVRQWFSQLFIDSYDWALTPGIYGFQQLGDTDYKLAIAPSSLIMQISDYERGEWADVWDGLYWRFVEKHSDMFKTNPRLRPIAQRLDRLDSDRKRIIGYRADDFLANYTR